MADFLSQFDSHKDVFKYLCESDESKGALIEKFYAWPEEPKWVMLPNPEYILLIQKRLPSSTDIDRFFLEHPSPYTALVKVLEIKEVAVNRSLYLEMVEYLSKYTPVTENNNEKNMEKLRFLKEDRAKIYESLLICPFDEIFDGYFSNCQHTNNGTDNNNKFIDCSKYVNEKKPVSMVSRNKFIEKFDNFTFGVLNKSPNPKFAGKKFPMENIVIAGGSISQLIEDGVVPFKGSDLDIFIYGGVENTSKIFENILSWFDTPNTYYCVKGSVISIYVVGFKRAFQIISTNFRNAEQVIANFDMSSIQWLAMDVSDSTPNLLNRYPRGLNVFGLHSSIKTFNTRISKLISSRSYLFQRVIKTLTRGYDIVVSDEILDMVDDDLIEQLNSYSQNIQQIRMGLYTYFFPEEDDDEMHSLSMIQSHEKTMMVSKDISYALKHVVLSGNFTAGYSTPSYTAFEIGNVYNPRGRRMYFNGTVSSRMGAINLTSGSLTIERFNEGDEEIEIVCKITDESFATFIKTTVRNQIATLFVNNVKIDEDLEKLNILKLKIHERRLQAAERFGKSLLIDNLGNPLDIMTELRKGDNVQLMFCINIESDYGNDGAHNIVIVPKRIVKFD